MLLYYSQFTIEKFIVKQTLRITNWGQGELEQMLKKKRKEKKIWGDKSFMAGVKNFYV